MKVFTMNDDEWVAGPSWFSVVRWYMRSTGLRKIDLEDSVPCEVSDSEMDRLQFSEEDGTKKSFRTKLAEMEADPQETFPVFFASTDC